TYSVGFNISDYRSHITRYDNPDKSFAKDYYVGQRIGEIWGYRVDGYFKSTEEAQEYAKHVDLGTVTKRVTGGWQAGDIKFLDLDGDRKIGVGSNTADNPGDRTIIGNSLASLQYGINASIRYFGFDVSAFFQGTGNHYWYPTGQCMPFWGAYSYSYVSFLRSDFRDLIWSEDNPDAYFPRPMAYAATSGTLSFVNDRYLQNLRYLRFKNLTVGYSLPQKWIRKAYLEKVRVYFTGENLCYWSPLKKNTKWLDPESAYSRSEQNNNLAYTFPKTYMVGIDITF
ncbi:MAG: SusC/RagA family protein, partial [Muribaculaceae bacterium]|nr:SusC/RagA family protein [Muribaculaceae bacterium]